MKNILLLDDDLMILNDVSKQLMNYNLNSFLCGKVEEATNVLEKNKIDFAIIDLFLTGSGGDHLSNDFIKEFILPRSIPYGRLTSATSLVPSNLKGSFLIDKRKYYSYPDILIDHLVKSEIIQ